MFSKFSQPSNARLPRTVTLGAVMLSRLSQNLNANSSRVVTFGKSTILRE